MMFEWGQFEFTLYKTKHFVKLCIEIIMCTFCTSVVYMHSKKYFVSLKKYLTTNKMCIIKNEIFDHFNALIIHSITHFIILI